jgi:hypothetical protein
MNRVVLVKMDYLVLQANQAIVRIHFFRFNIIYRIFYIKLGGDYGGDGYPGLIGMKGESL